MPRGASGATRGGALHGRFYEQSTRPVACETFRACLAVYRAAATEARPLNNVERQEFLAIGRLYGVADMPPDRAMFAVLDFLGESRRETAVAVSARIRALTLAIAAASQGDPTYKRLFKTRTAGGTSRASDAVIDAFAVTPFVPGTLDIDPYAVLQMVTEPSGPILRS